VLNQDPQWITFPRWIEHSGLPEELVKTHGIELWLLLKKLIEFDCDQNITPDWFVFDINQLGRFTGLNKESINSTLNTLETTERLDRSNSDLEVQQARIITPMLVPKEEHEIRLSLANGSQSSTQYILRYYQDLACLKPVENVVYLYQMIFGARFNPRIAEDLERIANQYDMGLIYEIFSEAHRRKVKSLSWIKSHLDKELKSRMEEFSKEDDD